MTNTLVGSVISQIMTVDIKAQEGYWWRGSKVLEVEFMLRPGWLQILCLFHRTRLTLYSLEPTELTAGLSKTSSSQTVSCTPPPSPTLRCSWITKRIHTCRWGSSRAKQWSQFSKSKLSSLHIIYWEKKVDWLIYMEEKFSSKSNNKRDQNQR